MQPSLWNRTLSDDLTFHRNDLSLLFPTACFDLTDNACHWEKELPHEMVIHILRFASLDDLCQLVRVTRNFRNYWLKHPVLQKEWSERREWFAKWLTIGPGNWLERIMFQNHVNKKVNQVFELECNPQYREPIKTICFGSSRIGKSKYLHRVKHGKYEDEYKETDSSELFTIQVKEPTLNMAACMTIWDLSGSDRFRIMEPVFFRSSTTFLFCFDLSNPESLSHLDKRIDQVSEFIFQGVDREELNSYLVLENYSMSLIGLKMDEERKISNHSIIEFINKFIPHTGIPLNQLRIQYFEVSAKEKQNLMQPIHFILSTKQYNL